MICFHGICCALSLGPPAICMCPPPESLVICFPSPPVPRPPLSLPISPPPPPPQLHHHHVGRGTGEPRGLPQAGRGCGRCFGARGAGAGRGGQPGCAFPWRRRQDRCQQRERTRVHQAPRHVSVCVCVFFWCMSLRRLRDCAPEKYSFPFPRTHCCTHADCTPYLFLMQKRYGLTHVLPETKTETRLKLPHHIQGCTSCTKF